MALDKKQLQDDLYAVFTAMKEAEQATDEDFADGIAEAICDYIKGGTVTTVDKGNVSGGTFAGGGSEDLSSNSTLSPDNCASIILKACTKMHDMTSGGDNYLAEEIGKGIKKMSTDLVIKTTVVGTLTPPSPATPVTPYPPDGGEAEGSIACSESSLVSALKQTFSDMYTNKDKEGYDGDLEFAKTLATQTALFWTSGKVSTSGKGDLKGSSGSGSVA
jgi:hypothetical protein